MNEMNTTDRALSWDLLTSAANEPLSILIFFITFIF